MDSQTHGGSMCPIELLIRVQMDPQKNPDAVQNLERTKVGSRSILLRNKKPDSAPEKE